MVKAPDPPPAFEEQEWNYRVDVRTPEAVHISARNGDSIWRFTFAPNGRLLNLRDPWNEAPFDAVADVPIFALYDLAQREGTEAWPRFPLEESFGLDHSDLRQRSHPAGSELEVTLVRAGRDAAGGDKVRTATQRWQVGRPWWSVLRIDAGYTYDGKTTTTVQLEGEVIAWPASTP